MKTKQFVSIFLIALAFAACTSDNFNYAPNVEILYSPVRLKDTASIVLKKGTVNNLKIDSMRIGDTLAVKVHIYDLVYQLKSLKFVTDADTSTLVILPSDEIFRNRFESSSNFVENSLLYKESVKSDDINFLYIAKKSSKNGHLTIHLETMNPDSVNYTDSLRLNSPVKFLP